ncbi:uncharacterized protein LOC124889315 isoform X11 [Capsicum annuum]|uniref:uncharacterized protein LOC124889315 isoform X11 n=1 Tax=Capsicum annuum TaxID=4072 RepID=UPI001FB12E2E|nr:uncharacterized protein LOC124889315 isoform X11 [Capsicum annuum]
MKIRGRLVFYVIHQMEKHGTILIECVQILLMNRGMFEWVCVLMNLQHFLSQLHQILVGQSLSHRLIPIAFSSLSERIWKSITEISLFFKELCSNTLKRDDLLLMKQNIRILCMRHYLEVLFNIDGCTHGKDGIRFYPSRPAANAISAGIQKLYDGFYPTWSDVSDCTKQGVFNEFMEQP